MWLATRDKDTGKGAERRRSLLSRLLRGEEAITTVEFALIMPLFFTMLFAIIEVSMVFFINVILEGAVDDGARLVRTGQAQTGDDPMAAFQEGTCAALSGVIACEEVAWQVEAFQDFGSADLTFTSDSQGNMTSTSYNPGAAGDIVVVRAVYLYEFVFPGLGDLFGNVGDGKRLITSAAVFRNEPFSGVPGV